MVAPRRGGLRLLCLVFLHRGRHYPRSILTVTSGEINAFLAFVREQEAKEKGRWMVPSHVRLFQTKQHRDRSPYCRRSSKQVNQGRSHQPHQSSRSRSTARMQNVVRGTRVSVSHRSTLALDSWQRCAQSNDDTQKKKDTTDTP